ncbi:MULTISPECIES: beta-ketoacyl-ACP synthase II [unclassified Mesorhizobium]|uniref:beta-ketoacyl-ACP synthase II n=1 Tax=unclassified Mesorhizobium TaxID=325217 RepID=UPI0011279586|nr:MULTISPECIES: beta-ketoacyl-ACP synthase II [unclassified Mesorhizobium]MBZ9701747.1 beta-ketoacyl-ACP synthase II [Mesorhizobium sp. CO1-1-3]MBZ9949095.1 beta-ketoacyl-ACP synthase II [Mesorhizobium sp. BR1-1-11]TPI99696.1 beta-ketoacyl-ACP synthase II [Mesorhizobium sp. B2-8-1]
MRRIVITGMGAVTPLAADVETSWSRLLASCSGICRLPDEMVESLPAKVGGLVPSLEEDPQAGFDPSAFLAPKEQRKVDRFILLALAAADEALSQARWKPVSETDRVRTATIIASGIGGFPAITEAVRTVDHRGVRRLSPFTVPSFLVNLAAGHISIRYGFKGHIGAPVTACAAGIQAIGDAARIIRADEADIAVCGGTEACINVVSLGGFAAARSLSTSFNHHPDQASRPFDISRDGFVMGEGAGLLVIEELSHALARGAEPLAEIVGYGTTADAHHVTSGPEDGDGARRAMEIAIAQAGISPREIRHLNAHATSTPVGDLGEIEAIKRVFGTDFSIAVSGTKSATGHLLGAAGGLGAIFTILALRDQVAPPTLNLSAPDPAGDGIDFVANKARPMEVEYALANGFGFGGVNASALFRRWDARRANGRAGHE